MFSGEISKNGNDGWTAITVASLADLQAQFPQAWTRKGDRTKKIRKLDGNLFPQFFTKTDSELTQARIEPVEEKPVPVEVSNPNSPAKNPVSTAGTKPGIPSTNGSPQDQGKLAQALLGGFQESLQRLGQDIGTALTRTVKADLSLALDANAVRLQTALADLAKTIGQTNFEAQARALAEKFLADLQVRADGMLLEIEKSAGKAQTSATETRDDLEKLRNNLEERLKALRNLQGDVNEDAADLVERIKKFGLGRVQVLEQQNEQLHKELDQARSENSRLHSDLTREKLARGDYDPLLFQRILKEHAEFSMAKVELDRTRLQLANAEAELGDLRPLRNAKLEAAQVSKELSDLREWKRKHQPELDRATDRAKVAGEEIRRLDNELKRRLRELRDLEEDRRSIQELKETSESYRNKATTLDARIKKVEASEARALEKVAGLEARVSEGRDAYKREIEAAHTREILQLRQQHGEELANCASELNRQSEDIRLWRGRAERLDAELKKVEEDKALGLRERYRELMLEHSALLTENSKRKNDIASAQAERALLSEKVANLRTEWNELQEKVAGLRSELAFHTEQLARCRDEQRLLLEQREEQKKRVFRHVFERSEHTTEQTEWEWLQQIRTSIKDAGFHFNSRLLCAFHTALKSQDISPLTLLAGISGTGKSELPRLYADAGGILFLPVAVQPNWDSPADLFGFYNYTEGVFHSTPLCRAVHQFTSPEHAQSMGDRMLLVLLDEMNLARVEYYFSDLLSRLEIRRGILRQTEIPSNEQWSRASVELNLGEGASSLLRLGTNVLFIGTLNQDESTLDLSPKVVDRANTITFPKPTYFVDMKAARRGIVTDGKQLPRERWEQWCTTSAELKQKVEEELKKKFDVVSSALDKVGRGVGQRVFQAAMRYVALYPTDPAHKRDGIQHAIEDQFAMKLIPKLKGLETRSKRGRDCLDLFEGVVPDRLRTAFHAAKSDEFFEWRGADSMFEVESDS